MQRTPTQLNVKSGKTTPALAILFKSAESTNSAKNLTKNPDFGPIFLESACQTKQRKFDLIFPALQPWIYMLTKNWT